MSFTGIVIELIKVESEKVPYFSVEVDTPFCIEIRLIKDLTFSITLKFYINQ